MWWELNEIEHFKITEEELKYIVERYNSERKRMCTQLSGINTYYERIKKDENSGVKWIDIDKVIDITNEEKMKPIYAKLNSKIKNI